MNEAVISIFTRAPVAGKTKTRLIPTLGAQGAADLHKQLIRHALETARAAAVGPIEIWRADADDDAFLRDCAHKFAATSRVQQGDDLGARMHHVFVAHGERPLLLMGADAPSITAEMLRDCARALREGADAVFLPADDGGYALVGLNKPCPDIFANMRWSVGDVMDVTRARLRALGLSWCEPAVVWDVDRPEDVARLGASGVLSARKKS